jgi:hypothetical protein
MNRGHQEDEWAHTTHIVVTLGNLHLKPGQSPLQFNDFYPFAKKKKQKHEAQLETDDKLVLKKMWLGTVGGGE